MSELYQRAIRAKESNNWNELYHCLQTLANTPLEKSEEQAIVTLVENSLKEEDFQARWDLIKILPKFGTAIIKPLIAILEDEEEEVELRWFVIKALSQFPTTETLLLSLTKLLQTTEEETLLETASQTLAQIGPSSIEELVKLQSKENLRVFIIEALSRINHPKVIPYLREALLDPSPEIRYKAIEGLSTFPDPNLIPPLLEALKDPSNRVKKEALLGLKYWCSPSYREVLLPALSSLISSVDVEVADQAIINLALLGGEQALQSLKNLLLSPFTLESSKKTLIRALGWLETQQALNLLILALNDQNLTVVTEAITVLGFLTDEHLKAEASIAIINYHHKGLEFQAMIAPNEKVLEDLKVAIPLALGSLGGEDAPLVLEVISQDPQPRIRLHAIAALKKLSR